MGIQKEIEAALEACGWFLDGASEKSEATYFANKKYAMRVRVAAHASYYNSSAECIQVRLDLDSNKITVGNYVYETVAYAIDEVNDYAAAHTFECKDCGSIYTDDDDATCCCK